MSEPITSLSAGRAINTVLSAALKNDVTHVYPVVSTENAKMPFVVYRRTGIHTTNTKLQNGFDQCAMEISVYSKEYAEGVAIMEKIRDTIEKKDIVCTKAADGFDLRMGCSLMTDCEEQWDDDCYCQMMTIECKIDAGNKYVRFK